jgi:hypothetical protein
MPTVHEYAESNAKHPGWFVRVALRGIGPRTAQVDAAGKDFFDLFKFKDNETIEQPLFWALYRRQMAYFPDASGSEPEPDSTSDEDWAELRAECARRGRLVPIDRLREILKLKPSEIEDILRARGEVARKEGEIDLKSLPGKIECLSIKLEANDVDLGATQMSATATTTTTAAATVAKKSAKNLPALVKTDSGSQIVPIATKAGGVGPRLMSKFEFRRFHSLSRSETKTQFAAYFEANSKEFSAQTADRINRGQLVVHSVTAGKGGAITIKAKSALPKAEVVTETKKEVKVMAEKDDLAALGLPVALLNALKALTPEAIAAIMATATPPAAPSAPACKGLDEVLAEAKAAAATAKE